MPKVKFKCVHLNALLYRNGIGICFHAFLNEDLNGGFVNG